MLTPLERYRKKIDALDARLAALLVERFILVEQLAGLKKQVRDPKREQAVLKHVSSLTKRKKLKPAAAAVYREIIKQGRRLQNDLKA